MEYEKLTDKKRNIYEDRFIRFCEMCNFTFKQMIVTARTRYNGGIISNFELRKKVKELEQEFYRRFRKNIDYKLVAKRIMYHKENPFMTAELRI